MLESMKIYDQNLEQIKTIFKQIATGRHLSPEMRREFFREAQRLLNASVADIEDYRHNNNGF